MWPRKDRLVRVVVMGCGRVGASLADGLARIGHEAFGLAVQLQIGQHLFMADAPARVAAVDAVLLVGARDEASGRADDHAG